MVKKLKKIWYNFKKGYYIKSNEITDLKFGVLKNTIVLKNHPFRKSIKITESPFLILDGDILKYDNFCVNACDIKLSYFKLIRLLNPIKNSAYKNSAYKNGLIIIPTNYGVINIDMLEINGEKLKKIVIDKFKRCLIK
jgi:UDP-2,3-diacylglucosamine pyrophosphatase LpxH